MLCWQQEVTVHGDHTPRFPADERSSDTGHQTRTGDTKTGRRTRHGHQPATARGRPVLTSPSGPWDGGHSHRAVIQDRGGVVPIGIRTGRLGHPATGARPVTQLGANAHGEMLEAGRVPDCHLGLHLGQADDAEAAVQPTGRHRQVAAVLEAPWTPWQCRQVAAGAHCRSRRVCNGWSVTRGRGVPALLRGCGPSTWTAAVRPAAGRTPSRTRTRPRCPVPRAPAGVLRPSARLADNDGPDARIVDAACGHRLRATEQRRNTAG
jgi:hypothetical protein